MIMVIKKNKKCKNFLKKQQIKELKEENNGKKNMDINQVVNKY